MKKQLNKIGAHLIAVGVLCGMISSASAQETVISGAAPFVSGSDNPVAQFYDFGNNGTGQRDNVGYDVGSSGTEQSGFGSWAAGTDAFSFTYNPTTPSLSITANPGNETYPGGGQSFSGAGSFNALQWFVENTGTGGADSLVVDNVTITVDGVSQPLSQTSFNNGSGTIQDYYIVDADLSQGFTISGDIEITGSQGGGSSGYYGKNNRSSLQFDIGDVAPVPEPTTLALAGLGGLSLMLFRRKRK